MTSPVNPQFSILDGLLPCTYLRDIPGFYWDGQIHLAKFDVSYPDVRRMMMLHALSQSKHYDAIVYADLDAFMVRNPLPLLLTYHQQGYSAVFSRTGSDNSICNGFLAIFDSNLTAELVRYGYYAQNQLNDPWMKYGVVQNRSTPINTNQNSSSSSAASSPSVISDYELLKLKYDEETMEHLLRADKKRRLLSQQEPKKHWLQTLRGQPLVKQRPQTIATDKQKQQIQRSHSSAPQKPHQSLEQQQLQRPDVPVQSSQQHLKPHSKDLVQLPRKRYFPTQLNHREYHSNATWKIMLLPPEEFFRGPCLAIPPQAIVAHSQTTYFNSKKKHADLKVCNLLLPLSNSTVEERDQVNALFSELGNIFQPDLSHHPINISHYYRRDERNFSSESYSIELNSYNFNPSNQSAHSLRAMIEKLPGWEKISKPFKK